MKYTSIPVSQEVKDKLMQRKIELRKKGIVHWDDFLLYLYRIEKEVKK